VPIRRTTISSPPIGRDARLVVFSATTGAFATGLWFVTLPVYMERLGFGPILAGTFFTAFSLTLLALVVPLGILSDRGGPRGILILGTGANAVAMAVLVVASDYVLFLGAAILLGVQQASLLSAGPALVAECTDASTRTKVFALIFFFFSLALAGGGLLAALPDYLLTRGLATVSTAYGPAFGVAAALAALGPLANWYVSVGRRGFREGATVLPRRSGPTILRFGAWNFVVGLGIGLTLPLFTLWFFLKFGLAETVSGPLFAVSSVLAAPSFLLAPFLARRFGIVRTVVAVQAGVAAVLVFLPIVTSVYVAAALFVALFIGVNMTGPVVLSFLMAAVAASERASAAAVFGVFFSLAYAASVATAGYLLTVDLRVPFFLAAAAYALAAVAFWGLFRASSGTTVGASGS
jgi:MFS family permease